MFRCLVYLVGGDVFLLKDLCEVDFCMVDGFLCGGISMLVEIQKVLGDGKLERGVVSSGGWRWGGFFVTGCVTISGW